VVTLNNGQTGEVVAHEENGLLIEPDRLAEIPDALTRVLQDDDLRRRLGRNAARYADRTLLSWDERIDREIARIEGVLRAAPSLK
jgi:glycosyltransferase involved in cell wall biosynthesis